MKKIILVSITFAACAGILFIGIWFGTAQAEKVECTQWQQEAGERPGYYITTWQAMQCDAHGIAIDAPIR